MTEQVEIGRSGKNKTRTAIVAAGLELLKERSLDAIPIDDIVRAAGVAKGSFYNHFPDKAALGRAIWASAQDNLAERIAAANNAIPHPAARIARALAVYLAFLLSEPDCALAWVRLGAEIGFTDQPAYAGLREDLRSGLESGVFLMPSIDVAVIYVVAVSQAVLTRVAEQRDKDAVMLVCQQLGVLMLRGLGLPYEEAEKFIALALEEVASHFG